MTKLFHLLVAIYKEEIAPKFCNLWMISQNIYLTIAKGNFLLMLFFHLYFGSLF